MSISKIQNPLELTPAYNPMMWVFNSTKVNEEGFRYIVKVMDESNNIIANLKVAPEPSNGYGYVDISKIISSQVSWDLDVNDNIISAPNSIFEYKINVSEEYLYSWAFYDTTFISGGRTRVNGSTPHIFGTGSQVNIIQDDATLFPEIDGLHSVVDFGSNYIDVDVDFVSTPLNPGDVYFADRSKLTEVGPTYSDNFAFNGRKSFGEFIGYNDDVYKIPQSPISTTKEFLTDIPEVFNCTPDQDIWLDFFKDTSDNSTINIKYENSNGDIFYTLNGWNNSFNSRVGQVAVGPNNTVIGGTVSGTLPLIKQDTTYYDFWLYSAGASQLTKKYRINLDRRCKIEDYEILFMDRLGSFVSYAFQLRAKETGSVDKKDYNQYLGDITSGGWSYDTTNTGQSIYSVNYDKKLELTTNWMNDEMSQYFEQIYTSPVTLLKDVDGEYYPIIINDTSFETTRQKNKILIKKTLKVSYANKEISNI